MVKSGIFLFELLKDCELPNSKVLKELNLTKPIQIFSYLINLETKKIQDKIDKSDKSKQKYGYKSIKLQSGIEISIQVGNEFKENDSASKIRKGSDGTMILKESLVDKKISPYVFKKINSVKEYKSLIQYCKFIEYNELINLLMKYDTIFLISFFEYMEFRVDITKDSLYYFMNLY